MAVDSVFFFNDSFHALTGRTPYPWQRNLFSRFTAPAVEPWPELLDLPTGAGKTSVLHVWLIALAWSVRAGILTVPRRLAWIVNRRVVVDQVTSEVEQILEKLREGVAECAELRALLVSLSLSGAPLAASTLRGQLADNGDWSRDPSTPAVIVGTVDMIGSRLLFRGYRAGRYHRPMHAGLLGVDTLVVNDESHLSPALARLLANVRKRNPAASIPGKCFRILLLSATHDGGNDLRPLDHKLTEDIAESEVFRRVFHAPKSLALHEVGSLNELDASVWKLATDSPGARTAIFIEQPEKAAKLAERLAKSDRPCALLTGTMRGLERDRLLEDETFRRFASRDSGADPVWLVCTSAGEVGINFSCERMITGLKEADHLLQRFGRLNRFGDATSGEAHVVFRNPSDKEPRLIQTLHYLRRLEGDVSCSNIWNYKPPAEARSEQPALARLEGRLIDLWAQTTYPDRFVPPVASWLHGRQESEAPETAVAWRSDVSLLAAWGTDPDRIREVLEYYPVQAHETLSEPSSRVAGKLEEIAEKLGRSTALQRMLIVVESDGTPSIRDLVYVVEQTRKNASYLDYKMLLLPDGLGSVPKGMFQPAATAESTGTMDVADENPGAKRIRFLFSGPENATRLPEDVGGETLVPDSSGRTDLARFAAVNGYRPPLTVEHPTNDDLSLVYFGPRSSKRRAAADVRLSDHHTAVAAKAKSLAGRVGLLSLEMTYEKAGITHDNGKRRDVWQRAMGGNVDDPLAKSKSAANIRLIDGYRHELGSLLDAVVNPEVSADDLLLHLIASHHAGARPYFETRQYDRKNLTLSAQETPGIARRFARLQALYGPWGLAYLEALFKCADGMVSAEEGEPTSA